MAYHAMFGMVLMIPLTTAVQMCSSLDNLTGVNDGKMLPDSLLLTLTTTGVMTCSKACLVRTRCQSFNFNIQTGECQLNNRTVDPASTELVTVADFVFSGISNWPDRLAGSCAGHSCQVNSYCEPVSDTSHSCQISSCIGSPTVANGYLNESPGESPIGAVLSHTCDDGYIASGTVECKDDGTWYSAVCESASSCSIVKQYQPDSQDGEYWLRLTNFGNYVTQMYCYNMSTSSPQEFLTLRYANYGIYPQIQDADCDGTTDPLVDDCAGQGGEVWFHKINVDITTMEVAVKDQTFANLSHHWKYLEFGIAFDCYGEHPSDDIKCGVFGNFNIDLRGTGWRVKADQIWEEFGWEVMIKQIDRQRDDTLISLHCGGYAGGCRPVGGLFLYPYPGDVTDPPSTHQDFYCDGTTDTLLGGCAGQGGEVWFHKINVDITTMEVAVKDQTFANLFHHWKYLEFGLAYDCYVEHPSDDIKCRVFGNFNIDLSGTGWRFKVDQVWEDFGWQAMIKQIDRQSYDTLISLYCGGYAGGCRPVGVLFLSPL